MPLRAEFAQQREQQRRIEPAAQRQRNPLAAVERTLQRRAQHGFQIGVPRLRGCRLHDQPLRRTDQRMTGRHRAHVAQHGAADQPLAAQVTRDRRRIRLAGQLPRRVQDGPDAGRRRTAARVVVKPVEAERVARADDHG